MSLSAAAIRAMADKGMSAQDIADIAEAMEGPVPQLSAGALRTRKWREGKEATSRGDVTETHHGDVSHVGERTQVVTPSLPSLRSEELAVVGECASERVSVDDWPTGKASDHADLLIATVASPWLDPSKSQDLVTTRGRVAAWKRDGASWEHDVLPVVTGLVAKRRARIGTWKFFDAAISQSIADNRAALEIPEAGTVIRMHATGPPRTIDEKSSASWDYAMKRIAEDG